MPSAASDWPDVLRLGALGAAHGGVLDPLVLLQAAVAVSLNRGVVDEDVGRGVIGGDETIALVRVEPLHCSLSHCVLLGRIIKTRSCASWAARSAAPAPGGNLDADAAVRIR